MGKAKNVIHNPIVKRSVYQREADLPLIAEWYLKGHSMQVIADLIGKERDYTLSVSAIRNDLAEIQKRWTESALVNFNEVKGRELHRIDMLEKAAWEAWERSQKDKETVERIEEQGSALDTLAAKAMNDPMLLKMTVKSKKEARDGNLGTLDIIKWCIEQRLKIFGMYAPQQLNVTWRQELEKQGIDPNAIIDVLARDIESQLASQAKPTISAVILNDDAQVSG